jgi:integrase/recombinase XerD
MEETKHRVRTQIYYKKDQALELELGRLNDWFKDNPDQDSNYQLILEFKEHLIAKQTGQYRIAKILAHLRRTCILDNTLVFDRATKQDIRGVIAKINTYEGWGEHSKLDYKRVLKHFYRWFEEEDSRLNSDDSRVRQEALDLYRYLTRHLVLKKPQKKVNPDELITDSDLQRLLNKGSRTPLERAFVSILHETGCRIGEMLGMRIGDIQRRGKHAVISVDGKTGERIVPILKSIPYLEQWLNIHPHRDDAKSILWLSISSNFYGRPLRYAGARKMLKRVGERAGIDKKKNAHWFRHSRASRNAEDMSESVLNATMGWTQGSNQAKTYVHMSGKQVEDLFMKRNGLVNKEEEKPTVQYCGCGSVNDIEALYCYKCGQPLSIKVANREAELMRKAFEILPKILANPQLRREYEDKLKEYG